MELGAGNVLLRLAEHGADMDMARVMFAHEAHIRRLRHCPDVRDCTLLAVRGSDGRGTVDILLALTGDADPGRERFTAPPGRLCYSRHRYRSLPSVIHYQTDARGAFHTGDPPILVLAV